MYSVRLLNLWVPGVRIAGDIILFEKFVAFRWCCWSLDISHAQLIPIAARLFWGLSPCNAEDDWELQWEVLSSMWECSQMGIHHIVPFFWRSGEWVFSPPFLSLFIFIYVYICAFPWGTALLPQCSLACSFWLSKLHMGSQHGITAFLVMGFHCFVFVQLWCDSNSGDREKIDGGYVQYCSWSKRSGSCLFWGLWWSWWQCGRRVILDHHLHSHAPCI